MMGSAMINSGKDFLRDKGFALLEQAYKSVKDSQSPTFKMHSVVILFKMLSGWGQNLTAKEFRSLKQK